MATESTDGGAPSDPLYTPIPVPEPFFPYADSIDTADASQLHMVMEEASTSELVHAACRLHEAMSVATDAFQKLIFGWTGLAPQEAATAALIYEMPKDDPPKDISMELLQLQRGMRLQTVLKTMQLLATVIGTRAGMAIDARALAVSHGLLLPLSAFESEDVAATFSAFTRRTTLATAKEDTGVSLSDMQSPLCDALRFPTGYRWGRSAPFRYEMLYKTDWSLFTAREHAATVSEAISQAAAAKRKKTTATTMEKEETAAAARRAVQDMVNLMLSSSIKNTAASTLDAVEIASFIAHWWRSSPSIVASLVARVLGRRTRTNTDDDEILQQALSACKQAVAAAESIMRPLARTTITDHGVADK